MLVTLLKYADHLDQLRREYEPRVYEILNGIKTAAEHEGLDVIGPYDMCDDMYRWSMLVTEHGKSKESGIDVSIEIAEQRGYEGGAEWGINFGLYVVRYGGRIVGEFQPFNFTPEVWVDSRVPYEVDTRWAYVESGDADDVVELILNDFANNPN